MCCSAAQEAIQEGGGGRAPGPGAPYPRMGEPEQDGETERVGGRALAQRPVPLSSSISQRSSSARCRDCRSSSYIYTETHMQVSERCS